MCDILQSWRLQKDTISDFKDIYLKVLQLHYFKVLIFPTFEEYTQITESIIICGTAQFCLSAVFSILQQLYFLFCYVNFGHFLPLCFICHYDSIFANLISLLLLCITVAILFWSLLFDIVLPSFLMVNQYFFCFLAL